MAENNFWIDLVATLKKAQSKKQIKSDAKNLGDIYVPLIGKLNKSKTRAQLKQDLASLNGTVNLTGKVNKKGIVTSVQQATQQAQTQANKAPIQVSMNLKKDKLINDIKVFGQQNTKLFKDANMAAKYNSLLDNAKLATSSREIQNLRLQLSAMRSEIKATNLSGLTLGDTFKKTFKRATELFTSTGGLMLLTRQMRQAWTEALNLDKAYTDLIKVQNDLSRGDYPEYLERCNKKAQELATTQKSLIEGATEFSKSGYDLDTSNKLTEKSTILANVGEMSASDSAKAIISGVQAYDTVDGYTDVVDKADALISKYNEIGNTASITTAEIAQGVQSVGSVFADANTSVDEFIALLAAGNRQYQDADALALGLRTAALRIRGCKVELEQMGEETDGVYTSASKLAEKIEGLTNINGNGGVKILEADGETFRSIYDIFLDISKVYKDMSDTDQSALLELISGKHRASAISATLNNMSEAQEIYQHSLEASGSAQREYDKYLESSEASLNRFKSSMTETYQSVIDGETVKGLLNCGNATLQFVNSLGLVESTLKGLVVIGIVKAITTLSTAFEASAIQASNFGTALNTVKNMSTMARGTTEYTNALKALKTVSAGLSDTQLKQVLASKALSDSDRIAILRTTGLTKAQAQAKLAQMGLTQSTKAQTTANVSATASTFSLTAAVKGFGVSLKTAFMSNPVGISIMALSTIIGAVSSKVSEYNEKLRETRQANMDAATSAKEKADSLRELYVKYENLSDITNKTSSQEEQFKQVVIDITKALGDKASALEGLTAGQNDYTEALKEATKAELESQYATAKIGAKAAEEELKDKTYDSWSGSQITIQQNEQMTGVKEHMAALEAVKDILAEYEDMGTYGIEWEPVNWDSNKDDMNAVVEYYNTLIEARNKLATADNADFLMSSDIYEDINNTINDLSESVEKYTEQQYNALKLNYEWQNGVPSTEEEFHKMEESILDASGAGQEFQEVLKGYLAEDFSTFSNSINNIENGIDDVTESTKAMTDKVSNAKDSLEDIIKQYPELVKMATVGELDEDVLTSTEQYADLLAKVGLNADSSSSDIKKLVEQIQAVADDNMIDNLKKVSDDFESLGDDYNTLMNKKEALSIGDLDKVQNVFGDLDVFDEWVAKVTDSKASTEELQKAFNDLATEYCNSSEKMQSVLKNVTNETKNATIAMLKQMGVINADEIVTAALTAQQLYLKLNTEDSTESIYEQISGLLEHSSASDNAKASLFDLVFEEQIFSNTDLGITDKIVQLEQLGLAFGVTADAAHSSARAMDAIRFAGMAGGKEAAEKTKEEMYEENSDWYRSQIAQKYANLSVNFKPNNPNNKKGGKGGNKGSGSKQEYKETVDWVEKTISLLTDKIALLNAKLDNTTSYKNQIKYIKKLADAQEKLIQVYDKAQSARSKAYNSALKKLSKSDRKKVESGAYTVENFKWTKSSDSKKMAENEKRYQNINEALEARDALAKAKQDLVKSKSELKKLASDLADKTWEKATKDLERFNNKMELLEKKLSNAKSYKTKNDLLAKQLDLEQKILSTKEKALSTESKELKSLGNKIKKGSKKLSSSKKEKIQKKLNSKKKFDIESLGVKPTSSLYQYMIEYNAFVDKIKEETDNLAADKQETISSINEKAQSIVDNVWDNAMDKVESLSNKMESLNKVLENTDGLKERNKLLEQQIQLSYKMIEASKQSVQDEKKKQKLYKKNIKNAYKKLSSKDKKIIGKSIKAGKTINLKDLSSAIDPSSKLYKNIIKYNAATDKIKEGRQAYQDQKQESLSAITQKTQEKYNSIQNYYEKRINHSQGKIDKLQSYIDLAEAKGQGIGKAFYERSKELQKNETNALKKKKKELENQLKNDVKIGRIKVNSDEWYEALDVINECEKGINESRKAQEEFNKSVKQLDWSNFDMMISKLDDITNESNFLINLMSNKKLVDKNGSFTNEGITAQAQHVMNYNIYMKKADELASEIAKIPTDTTNKDDLERRNELIKLQQDSILSAESEKKAIIDLVDQGIQAEIKSMSDLISKKKEALDAEKDLHNYQKSIAEKNKNIAKIQKQINALSGDDSDENKKKLRELKAELAKAQDDLNEAEYNHSIDEQKKALDKSLEDFTDSRNKYLEDSEKVFNDTITMVNKETSIVSKTVSQTAKNVGYTVSTTISNSWKTAGNAVSTYSNTFTSATSSVLEQIKLQKQALEELIKKQEELAQSTVSNVTKEEKKVENIKPSKNATKIDQLLSTANGKKTENMSELNKYVHKKYGTYLSKQNMLDLAKLLGLKGITEKSIVGNYKQKDQILKALKGAGFANGGIAEINKVIKGNGDDGIVTIKPGETILTEAFTKELPQAVQMMDKFIHLPLPSLTPISKQGNISNTVEINIGNMPNVIDTKSFISELQNNNKVQKAIQKVALSELSDGNIYSVNKIH
ncbi:phage tail tape measure protein [Velocimicrobium porci]|uniref:Phage tail tape measure protein domain-containing protein n=1 Tax=Velocimicrobium porci TaxID=2606634 RepID=A0A6L5XYK7_9FIRM|nr:phage tail tape measure protein [Velocimicrobium porci]MSS63709.1 hypothetical protein [Velocimicrobium porci]